MENRFLVGKSIGKHEEQAVVGSFARGGMDFLISARNPAIMISDEAVQTLGVDEINTASG